METFKCYLCKKILPITAFYKKKNKIGHGYYCKTCQTMYINNWRKNNPDTVKKARKNYKKTSRLYDKKYRELNKKKLKIRRDKNKHKVAAHGVVRYKIKKGELKRPCICPICKESRFIYAHHNDYSKPLEIDWMCARCHGLLHHGVNYTITRLATFRRGD